MRVSQWGLQGTLQVHNFTQGIDSSIIKFLCQPLATVIHIWPDNWNVRMGFVEGFLLKGCGCAYNEFPCAIKGQ